MNQFRIQIGFRLIPEEDGTFEQCTVLEKKPDKPQLAKSLGQQGKFQVSLFVFQKELFPFLW